MVYIPKIREFSPLPTRGLSDLTSISGPLFTIVVSIIALVTANRVRDEPVNFILAVLGFIAGGAGGALVAVAGISAVISRHAPTGSA